MSRAMFPTPNRMILDRRDCIVADLGRLVPLGALIISEDERRTYETDALTALRKLPLAVVLPGTTEEVAAVLRYCHLHNIPVVPRGAGTSLVGGSTPQEDAVVVGLSKMTRILAVDYDNRAVAVQAGVTNLAITAAVQDRNFFYAPDPSSQLACSIGGNIAMNSGGAHCLKYGVTTNNLLGVKMVMIDGTVVEIGGVHLDAGGYDLLGIVAGSEGQLGIVTEATVRILSVAENARPVLLGFPKAELASAAVSGIISAGIIPVAIEYMDKMAIDTKQQGVTTIKESRSAMETAAIWKGRKSAFGATGRIADYICMDGTIPTGRLSEALTRIDALVKSYGLRVANVFHAGDGNLHPLVLYNINDPVECEKAEDCGLDILKLCVELGGCLTGEHGVGIEKRDLMRVQFSQEDLVQQMRVRAVFDPAWLLNPAKVFPLEGRITA